MNAIPKIRILVPNPKKPGSKAYERFARYVDGMTVSEALKAGLTREDLRYDVAHKFIDITTLENRADGSAPNAKPSSNRDAALKRIKALAAKTVENGCTEEEAMAAMAKMGELMDRYGIESSETEIREEVCVTGVHGAERLKTHPSSWCAKAIAAYCDCRVWHRTGTGRIMFFGLPADVEVATYLMKVVEGAMDRGFKNFKKSPDYPSYDPYPKRTRNTYMVAFSNRVNARLAEMHKARHTEQLVTTTGTSLIVVKNAVVTEQWAKTGVTLRKASTGTVRMSGNDAARAAGVAGGNAVHLGSALSGNTTKRLA